MLWGLGALSLSIGAETTMTLSALVAASTIFCELAGRNAGSHQANPTFDRFDYALSCSGAV